jgi:hypothetical protein
MNFWGDDDECEHPDEKYCVIKFHFFILHRIIREESGNIVESEVGERLLRSFEM